MNLAPPPSIPRFAKLFHRFQVGQNRLLELYDAGALSASTDLSFVRRIIDAHRELKDPANRCSPRNMITALDYFADELDQFEIELVQLAETLPANAPAF
jgi:hypothetical protein